MLDKISGSVLETLRANDSDNEILTFNIQGEIAKELLMLNSTGPKSADIILKSPLNREVWYFSPISERNNWNFVPKVFLLRPSPFLFCFQRAEFITVILQVQDIVNAPVSLHLHFFHYQGLYFSIQKWSQLIANRLNGQPCVYKMMRILKIDHICADASRKCGVTIIP